MAAKTANDTATRRPKSVTVRLQVDQLSAIDAWRRQQHDKPSRAGALMRLAAKALTTGGAH